MKTLKTILILTIILLNINPSYSQEVKELTYEPLDKDFIALKQNLEVIKTTDDQKSIDLCLNALDKFNDMSIRYYIIFWRLSFHWSHSLVETMHFQCKTFSCYTFY